MTLGGVLFPALMIAVGLVYEIMAIQMPRGSFAQPGPGLYPMIVGVFLIITSCGCLLRGWLTLRRAHGILPAPLQPGSEAPCTDFVKTIQLMALMVAYVLAVPAVGFPIAIFTFLVVAIRLFGYRKWAPAAAMALIIAVVSYVSFVLWLKVPLPLGIFEDVLG